MSATARLRALFALLAALVLAFGVAACGDDEAIRATTTVGMTSSSTAIEANPDNEGVELTIGSKNFDEQFILGEIYAQALEAAGYTVNTDLNLGSEQVALKALEDGEISGYPEYTSTALTSFFGFAPEDVPGDPQQAYADSQEEFEKKGLVAFPPTPFSSANAVGLLTRRPRSSTSRRSRTSRASPRTSPSPARPSAVSAIDCLKGLEDNYGLTFGKFTPVDIELRYEVLDKEDADLSILFTTDGQLAAVRRLHPAGGRPGPAARGQRALRRQPGGGRRGRA